MKHRILPLLLIATLSLSFVSLDAQARRGCCSHHGGVNYCDRNQGSYVCNDGTYSPTCGCAMDNPPATQSEKPAKKKSADDSAYLGS